MTYTIIEDCSPYYIRFTWNGLQDIINFVRNQEVNLNEGTKFNSYVHYNFNTDTANNIIDMLPMKNEISLIINRVALFVTNPGKKSSIHKDGATMRCGINIPISIHDRECVTSWFSDESLATAEKIETGYTRKVKINGLEQPIKSIVFAPNECVLFNTDIYHSWDNTNSTNYRSVLTLRVNNPGSFYFEDARQALFGY